MNYSTRSGLHYYSGISNHVEKLKACLRDCLQTVFRLAVQSIHEINCRTTQFSKVDKKRASIFSLKVIIVLLQRELLLILENYIEMSNPPDSWDSVADPDPAVSNSDQGNAEQASNSIKHLNINAKPFVPNPNAKPFVPTFLKSAGKNHVISRTQ